MNAGTEVPHDADWVSALSACELATLWAALENRIRQDIEAWRQAFRQREGIVLEVNVPYEGELVIIKTAYMNSRVSRLRRAEKTIVLRPSSEGEEIVLTPRVNDQGRCVLVTKRNEELELWEVSRLVLEEVLLWIDF